MEKDYWLERWEQEEIGFHQSDINPYLCQYWKELHLSQGSEVFVPLCGKSRDMLWLREQGYMVLGVELSAIGIQTFFKENGFTPNYIHSEKFNRYEANSICILGGNFFDLDKKDLAKVSAVYDRASLVALPLDMRESYVSHLLGILPPASQILLVTFDYSQSEMSGPPFSVSVSEVDELYSEHAKICLVARLDVLERYPRFHERGVSKLQENIFLLTLHNKRM
ncbi:MAG: thiopurine S-methyltransferase [Nitrosomonadales bacterium]|jgi:thiopurine S-methyltransferase|nr:MAG: thiopurine S-methyltransferase [Nitrosomonadales bacterium]